MPLLRVENLSAAYGALRVLHDVSLEIDEGELVSLIGPNGAGKTTILRAISRLAATEGSIRFDDREITTRSPQEVVALGVVQCAEGRKLFPDMTVGDNLDLGAYLRSDREGIRADLERVYGLFPVLESRRGQRAGTMSGGEQQMLAIGRALMSRPRILLLDEPSFGISPILVERIFAVIMQLNREGLTALVVEQNAAVALEVSARTYVLESGRIVLSGPSRDVAENRAVRETYLGM
ncbi:MAG: ABC transporter ATP-binding protein [Thiotrichales bacterium]|nr:ABC transporter ATP-binding protein [Thiotrichales bacterium]